MDILVFWPMRLLNTHKGLTFMPQNFDAYRDWLKIPTQDQPPHHYRLLGIKVFESDANKIDQAVNQLVARLQTLSNGPHVEQAQQLLNQVAKARICLTDPIRKADYDRRLQATLKPQRPTAFSQATNLKSRPEQVGRKDVKANQPTVGQTENPTKSKSAARSGENPTAAASPLATTTLTSSMTTEVESLQRSVDSTTKTDTAPDWPEAEPKRLRKLILSGVGMMILGGLSGFLIVGYLLPQMIPVAKLENQNYGDLDSTNTTRDPTPSALPNGGDLTRQSDDRQATTSRNQDRSSPQRLADESGRQGEDSRTEPPSRLEQVASLTLEKLEQQALSTRIDSEHELPVGVFSPFNASRFADQLQTNIQIEAVALEVKPSNSGLTNYIFFADRNKGALMVFAESKEIDLASFQQFSGKRVRVSGPVSKRGQELGIRVKNLDQITIVQ